MRAWWERMGSVGSVCVRFAVGLSFLSAVADRFGWWGPPGQPNVAWGEFDKFVAYTGTLNWFLPHAMIPPLAVIATCAEIVLGLLFLVGLPTRLAASPALMRLQTRGPWLDRSWHPRRPSRSSLHFIVRREESRCSILILRSESAIRRGCPCPRIAGYPEIVRAQLAIPAELSILCSLAVGYPDPDFA